MISIGVAVGRATPERARHAAASARSASLARPRRVNSYPHDRPIMVVNDRDRMPPVIASTRDVCHIYGPALVAGRRLTHGLLNAWAWRSGALCDLPAVLPHQARDARAIDGLPQMGAQQDGQPAIPKGRMGYDQHPQGAEQHVILRPVARSTQLRGGNGLGRIQTRSGDP